ncbi:PLP-dependent aminotransferase family protein [Variovorax sp. J22G21]|uniref:MocR-like pyridoxine biosynthesis transcription factor PdxR n=1 Tax=Variovorax fucosicus TaxID=3053517 RepID=UPI00257748ED|nr:MULTISPECIES: PLP-dependent aminotransferase family protein [unclassified Variovorax]MDM0039213.1 PLP-dependent aminotransferase family protein [Variovorax sp. J22R193]MDM0063989.1 PLP-dependent aminotransferase family protein [Variovorax sp. J22G21]
MKSNLNDPSADAPSSLPELLETPLDRVSTEPLQRQLCRRIKEAIVTGHLPAGLRLPATRVLAQALAVSRNTASLAYEQLLAEGYVLADRQGTVVAMLAQSNADAPRQRQRATAAMPTTSRPLASRLAELRPSAPMAAECTALRPGVPTLAQFPFTHWRRALDRAWATASASTLNYGDPLGQMPLRAAIANHLALTRGVHCTAAQVVITEGAQEALTLCVRLLTNPGDTAWMEDPGYRGAKSALQAGDLRVLAKRLDAEGLQFGAKDWLREQPRLIYTTPSHQYPIGTVMSVARRLALIAAAQAHGAWIIEDDYDSEFRHSGDPIGAMQGLVEGAPVLYVGTFSKTMFPALRLGFLVVPPDLLAVLTSPLRELLRGGHSHEQLAMAHFIESGQFARHLGRARRLYRERQQALREALSQHLGVPHSIEGGRCGLHLCVRIDPAMRDVQVVEAARRWGMAPQALSTFALAPQAQDNGLVLGYGNTPIETIAPLAKRLGMLLRGGLA